MKVEHSSSLMNTQLVKETHSPSTKRAEAASEEVQLSSLASQLFTSESEAPFDASSVEKIKQAIAAGKFSINAGAIADRLIVSAKELISTQQR